MPAPRPAGTDLAVAGTGGLGEKKAAMSRSERSGWVKTVAEALGLSAACFVLALIFGGNGPGEAAVAAVAVAGSPNPSASRPLHSEVASILSAFRHAVGSLLRQDFRAQRRTAA
jgi:hypothetical protein